MLFADNIQRHVYRICMYTTLRQPHPLLLSIPFLFALVTQSLLTWRTSFSCSWRIYIHSCPWFAINCSPLVASHTPRHPTDQVTYLHRRHQQHQLSRLIHVTLHIKQYKVYQLYATNNFGINEKKIVDISFNLKPNSKSIQIPNNGLRRSPFATKAESNKSHWTVL
jgi:hypothetical protein